MPRLALIAAGAAGLILAAALAGCSKPPAAAPAAGPQALPVSTAAPSRGEVADTSTYVASLQSRDSMVISPLVSGIITRIFVHSGDRLRAGDPVLQIDDSLQQTVLRNAENALTAARPAVTYDKQQLDRIQALFSEGIETRADLEQVQSNYNGATAQLAVLDAQVQQQQVQLGYYRVNAPRSGIVGDIPVKAGDQVMPSTQLTTLDEPGNLEIYVQVPIERAAALHPGLSLDVLDGAGNLLAHTSVRFVSPQVDSITQTILVKADLPATDSDRLRAQQFVQGRIGWSSHNALLVPVLSVVRVNGSFFVYLAARQGAGFVAHQAPISVGSIAGNNYEVVSGLSATDQVIVSSTQLLVDGMPVMPLPPATARGGR